MSAPNWRYQTWAELDRDQLYAILALRQRVFVVEHARPCLDADGADPLASHLWCADPSGAVIAYLRTFAPGIKCNEASIGRIVTDPGSRRRGLGKALIIEGLRRVEAAYGHVAVRIVAQQYLEAFYRELGFVRASHEITIDRIVHVEMLRPQ